MDRKSVGRKSEDGRSTSVTSVGTDEIGGGIKRMPTTLTEQEGDDDVGNGKFSMLRLLRIIAND